MNNEERFNWMNNDESLLSIFSEAKEYNLLKLRELQNQIDLGNTNSTDDFYLNAYELKIDYLNQCIEHLGEKK